MRFRQRLKQKERLVLLLSYARIASEITIIIGFGIMVYLIIKYML